MRPYYYVKDETWIKCFSKTLDISKPYLSLNSDYGRFVSKYLQYPSLNEFILYTYRNYALNSKVYSTLPKRIDLICKVILKDFVPVIKDVTPEKFAQLYNDSVEIKKRIELEKS